MYKVLLGDELVHYAPAGIELIDPVLELEDNKCGSFKFGLAPGQPGYDLPQKLVTTVEVWCDGEALFYGRVFDESMALDRMKTVTCEGELAYLIDSIQRPASYEHVTLTQVLQSVLAEHNSQVEPFKQFELGNVTVPTPDGMITIRTDWEDTLKFIQETLLGLTGGHLVIRHADGKRYLDYLESYNRRNTQGIEFGRNLIDYSQTASAENIATCVIPLGAKLEKAEDAPEDEPDRYLTIESVNGGKDYVYNEEAVATYGWVSTAVKFDDETDPERLKEKGEEYLSSTQDDSLSLTLTAFDLGHLNADIQKIRVGDEIRVYSKPHGMDRYFPVTKQTVNLNNPEKDQIELGTTVSQNLTDRIAEGNKEIIHRIESLPSQSSTVKLAEEAAQRFAAMAAATVGYYTSTETLADGSIITYSHDKPERSQSTNIWKRNGLAVAVSNDGGKTWRGLDKDGNAILENIAAKTISASKIVSGRMETEDGRFYIDLDKSESTATRLITEESWLEQYPKHKIEAVVGQEEIPELPMVGFFLQLDGVTKIAMTVGNDFLSPALYLIGDQENAVHVAISGKDLRLGAATDGEIVLLDDTRIMGDAYLWGALYTNFIRLNSDIGSINLEDDTWVWGDLIVDGSLQVNGPDKQRVVETSKGLVGINAYETAEPYFGDIGESTTDENGQARIEIDPLFAETVNTSCPYQVFLQSYCEGEFHVIERKQKYFKVKGAPNGRFGYEIKARQKNYEMNRLEVIS